MKNFVLRIFLLSGLMFMSGCTYNVSMAHTQGTATDVIDDVASNTPTVSPTVTVPVSALPSGASIPALPVINTESK